MWPPFPGSAGSEEGPRRRAYISPSASNIGGESLVHQAHTGPLGGTPGASAIFFAACTPPHPGRLGRAGRARRQGGAAAELIAAAKAEGGLTTIALPHTWCNYGEMLSTFTAKYGIPINELNPDGSSAEEIDAIKANKDNPGPQAPDVIDIGLGLAPQAVTDGLLQPYKVATWDTIPATAKDADGNWYGDYYGVLSFETNTAVVKNVPRTGPTC